MTHTLSIPLNYNVDFVFPKQLSFSKTILNLYYACYLLSPAARMQAPMRVRIFVLFTDVSQAPRTQLKNSEGLMFIINNLVYRTMDAGCREFSHISTKPKYDSFETTRSFLFTSLLLEGDRQALSLQTWALNGPIMSLVSKISEPSTAIMLMTLYQEIKSHISPSIYLK